LGLLEQLDKFAGRPASIMSAEGRGDQYLLMAESTTTETTPPWQLRRFQAKRGGLRIRNDKLSRKPV
jgi:hypothetical protein